MAAHPPAVPKPSVGVSPYARMVMADPAPIDSIRSSTAITARSTQGLNKTASDDREARMVGGVSPLRRDTQRWPSLTTALYITEGDGAYFHLLPTMTWSDGGGHGGAPAIEGVPYELTSWQAFLVTGPVALPLSRVM